MKVTVGVPAGRDAFSCEWVYAWTYTLIAAAARKCELVPMMVAGSSSISGARTRLAHASREKGHDAIFFIDDDVTWKPDDFLNVLAGLDRFDVCAGSYSHRATSSVRHMVINPGPSDKDGYRSADRVPGGFMAIRGQFLSRMLDAYKGITTQWQMETFSNPFAEFEETADGYKFLSDDYAFCDRVKEQGGTIGFWPKCQLKHETKTAMDMPYEEWERRLAEES